MSRVELGTPFLGSETAEFTAAGGRVYVTIRRFEHGGAFDPRTGSAKVYLGPAGRAGTFDRQTGAVTGSLADVHVEEGSYVSVELAAGRYWLWISGGADVLVVSCDRDGVTDGRRA